MRARLAQFLITALSYLPLPQVQVIGRCLARLAAGFSPRFRQRIQDNLHHSKIAASYQSEAKLVKQSIDHIGMGAAELSIAWCRTPDDIMRLVQACEGWEHIEAAQARGEGLLLVTPHLGNYDIAGRYVSQRLSCPLTAMYRPPKLAWLEPVMNQGRVRDKGKTAPATPAGVRQIMKALRAGEATVILPDQVPSQGDGVWAPFFGRPAYTMTLVPRLATMKGVTTLFFYGHRLPKGEGFIIKIRPLQTPFTGDKEHDVALMNQMVESVICEAPEQYLWSYNRYKKPAGVQLPSSAC